MPHHLLIINIAKEHKSWYPWAPAAWFSVCDVAPLGIKWQEGIAPLSSDSTQHSD